MANLGLQNNNAGNLKDPMTGKFQVFDTPDEGYNALIRDLEIKKTGKSKHIQPGGTILDLANVWAPASDNNIPSDWARNVARTVGMSENDRWDTIPTESLAKGIQVAEGTYTGPKQAPTGQLAGSGTRMSKSDFGKKIKQKYPQYQSIPDEELADKIIAKYPQYKDAVRNTGLMETTPGASWGEKLVDNSATQYVADKVKDGTAGNILKKAYHFVADPLVDVAQIPVQLGVKIGNKLTGGNVQDPFEKKPITLPFSKDTYKTNKIDNIAGKAGSAIETAGLIGAGGLIKKALGKNILKSSVFKKTLVDDIGMNYEKFNKLSKVEKVKALLNAKSHWGRDLAEGSRYVIDEAVAALTKESPGLIKKALNVVTGGRMGITDLMGLKEGYDLFNKYIK